MSAKWVRAGDNRWERWDGFLGYAIRRSHVSGDRYQFTVFVEDQSTATRWRPIGHKYNLPAAKAFAARHKVTGFETE